MGTLEHALALQTGKGDTHMSQDTPRDQMSRKRVVYTMPGMEAVTVRRDEPYRVTDAGAVSMDLYYPPDSKAGVRAPAVIFVTGFSDPGAERMFGSPFKDMGPFVSWARLVATSGLVGVTYANREPEDVHAVLHYVQENGASLGIDGHRIGIWACSGHAPNALSVLMERGREGLRCAVLAYPYTLDLNGSIRIGDAAKQFRFVTPAAGKSVGDLPLDLPLFLVRAGRDEMPGLNGALDQFVAQALAHNLPMTVINHASGPHAFDLFDDTRTAREIIKQILAFLQFHLSV
jgi:hypothetical protein